MRDYGLRVSPRLQQAPIWKVSSRAFRLWVFLAMKAQHAPQNVVLTDGQRIRVQRGQWLTSTRKLRKELGGGSLRSITAAIAELQAAGAISAQSIPRYRSGNTPVTDSVTPPRYRNGNADSVMATLVTVAGLAVASDPVTETVTKEVQSLASPISARDRRERERAEQILEAEGR